MVPFATFNATKDEFDTEIITFPFTTKDVSVIVLIRVANSLRDSLRKFILLEVRTGL